MTTETLTLTDFLLARIAEDEALAQIVLNHEDDLALASMRPMTFVYRWSMHYGRGGSSRSHEGAPSPRRVLAECAAKRGAIEEAWHDLGRIESEWGSGKGREQLSEEDDNPAVVEWLALPYADHPDYREEWRP